MDAFVAAVRRIVRLDGESVLTRAISGLEKAKTRLYAAANAIDDEEQREQDAAEEARRKYYEEKNKRSARIATLRANYERAVRVASRIAGLVE